MKDGHIQKDMQKTWQPRFIGFGREGYFARNAASNTLTNLVYNVCLYDKL